MDGLQATRHIRALPGHADTPIIAVTANAFADDRRRCAEAGMNDFLAKPFSPEELFRLLLGWLTVRRAQEAALAAPVPEVGAWYAGGPVTGGSRTGAD